MVRIIKMKAGDGDLNVNVRVSLDSSDGNLTMDEVDAKKEKLTDAIHEALKEFFFVSRIKIG